MEILYKKDIKGKILQWHAELSGNNDIMISAGELEGAKTISWRINIKGKNIGKINETTDRQQALNDIESLYNDKRKRGYKSVKDLKVEFGDWYHQLTFKEFLEKSLSQDTSTLSGDLKPMKCQQYYRSKPNWTGPDGKVYKDRKYYYLNNPYVEKEKGAIIMNFPCLIQPKINGVRCTAQLKEGKIILLSKEGLEYNIPHILEVLELNKHIFELNNILDGELYISGESLQEITSAVKKANLNTHRIQYNVFDLAISNIECLDRIKLLKDLINSIDYIPFQYKSIIYVKTWHVNDDKNVQYYTDLFISEGYEGSIIRDPQGLYQFGKRPQCITKLKRLIDEEFIIIGVKSQEVNSNLGMFICRTKEGKEFTVNPTMSEADKEMILFSPESYIGKQITCSFYEYTEDGIPFHIVDNIIRDYE